MIRISGLEGASQVRRVGFIGLGYMGAPMAANIERGGFDLAVFDIDAKRTEPFRDRGTRVAASIEEVACGADIVCLALHDDSQIEDVVTSRNGLFDVLSYGSVILVFSTATPTHCRELARKAIAHGYRLLDAPVSGGFAAAHDGTLTLAVGGAPEDIARCLPIFEAVATSVFHAGEVGSGQLYKLLNNAVGITTRIALGETLAVARAADLDEDELLLYLAASTGDSWHVRNWRTVQESVEHSTGGARAIAATARKDLQLAMHLAGEACIATPLFREASLHTDEISGPNG